MANFKLILTAPNPSLFAAFENRLADFPNVEIIADRALKLQTEHSVLPVGNIAKSQDTAMLCPYGH